MTPHPTKTKSEEDHKAAYLNALMWNITKNEAHAQKSIEILNAYAGTLREIDMSDNDAPLCAALQGFLLANAAELMRHTYPSVSDTDVKSWENMFRNVFIEKLLCQISLCKRQLGNRCYQGLYGVRYLFG